MDDLIKRSDAIEAIEIVDWYHQNKNKDMVSGANSNEHQAWYKADDVYKALEAVPAADRPKGEWVATDVNDEWYGLVYKCNICGSETIGGCDNFCPNCGAQMKGVSDEDRR